MLGDYMGPRIRTGRCDSCAHHLVFFDHMGEPICCCELEENATSGWFPGMHLDYCVFPPMKPGDACTAYEPCEELLAIEREMPLAPSERLRIIIGRNAIRDAVRRLAAEIRRDYQDKNPLIVCILKGSFVFTADLVRALNIPLEVEFVQLSSYGTGRTESSGEVSMVHDLGTPVEGRHVLVVEDIVDTGLSLKFLLDHLEGRNPSSLKLCSLLDKPSRRRAEVSIDYLGFEVPDVFVVGYGIDFDERFRYLSDICAVEWNDVS